MLLPPLITGIRDMRKTIKKIFNVISAVSGWKRAIAKDIRSKY